MTEHKCYPTSEHRLGMSYNFHLPFHFGCHGAPGTIVTSEATHVTCRPVQSAEEVRQRVLHNGLAVQLRYTASSCVS